MDTLSVVAVGLGKQNLEDHLPAIEASSIFKLIGVVDEDKSKLRIVTGQYGVTGSTKLNSLLANLSQKPDVAVVAVPHNCYAEIIEILANNKIHIIKEKPFATSIKEATEFKKIAEKNGIGIYVTLQRRFNPIFVTFNQLIRHIGDIYSIEGRYTMNIPQLDKGWRAKKSKAGGGALIDMGYHFIDLIVWYFGLPDTVNCKLSRCNRQDQRYDVEDTALLNFTYNDSDGDENRILGNILVSRTYPQKEESLTVYGSKGSVQVQRGKLIRKDLNGNPVEILERQGSWPSAAIDQLEEFGKQIINNYKNGIVNIEYMQHIAFIEAAYDSNKLSQTCNPHSYLRTIKKEVAKGA